MAKDKSKILLVEGETDLCVIAEVIEASGVPWRRGHEPVDIKILGTKTPVEGTVGGHLKDQSFKRFGIILDADRDPEGTWQQIAQWLHLHVPNLPNEIPATGFISNDDAEGRRFGVWIMPDCHSKGTLESLLKLMVRPQSQALLEHAVEATAQAKIEHAAPFKDVHREKAEIFNWLAWQDEPGRNFKDRDFESLFDPKTEAARPFVDWFRRLFDV